ncbi:MAG: sulfur carrier protein ThiS [Limisphaerales bacterium]
MSDREQMRVKANGAWVEVVLPLTLGQFLVGRGLLPRSVVVEQNGEAVAPSEFAVREVRDGDVLEIVEIVAGG